ncbi:FecR protein [Parapedobacter composti]|uniref:FecR protein n=1 Tax=Parapedobacter composti TaxID=623281 RepID=A0A1I1M5Y0_9SPHI|nr:FecR family protein [Parapedobacter composti]SFC80625.1 FecR protein [Parapedobacter composti]
MDKERFVELIGKMEQGSASEAELRELDAMYEAFEQKPGITGRMSPKEKQAHAEKLFRKISAHTESAPVQHHRPYRRMTWISAAAAICLIALWWGYGQLSRHRQPENETRLAHQMDDALPAADKAYLTLADGRSVTLDESASAKLAQEPGNHFTIDAEGALVYRPQGNAPAVSGNTLLYHTITTPKGGQYQVVLPDGTKVWMNAGSSLTFPIAFTDRERSVKMTGEVYFDVAKVRGKRGRVPFIVETPKQRIAVLGTQFNVQAYPSQTTEATTLIEGSVRVNGASDGQGALLRPGQQALFVAGKMNIQPANTEKELAWKNGMFRFEDDHIRTVMQQLENWYDVDIDYSHMPGVHLNGGISRRLPLSKVLNMLEVTGGFKFEINAKKVKIISNKQIVNPQKPERL